MSRNDRNIRNTLLLKKLEAEKLNVKTNFEETGKVLRKFLNTPDILDTSIIEKNKVIWKRLVILIF